jgi:hypothetical protein
LYCFLPNSIPTVTNALGSSPNCNKPLSTILD